MSDSYTTNLHLTKPEYNASDDTWGTKQNAAFDILDALLGGVIYGLTLSAAGSTATFGIAAGSASGMALASAYTKTASSWALGTAAGSLDTGSVANSTWYHVWLIQRSDTGVVDILTSTNATSPTMPTNYDRKRRIGSMLTDGSAKWVKFIQVADDFLWDAPVVNKAAFNTGTSANSITATVPLGIVTRAKYRLGIPGSGVTAAGLISALTMTDLVPDNIAGNVTFKVNGVDIGLEGEVEVDTSQAFRLRTTSACSLFLVTYGWRDTRGRG